MLSRSRIVGLLLALAVFPLASEAQDFGTGQVIAVYDFEGDEFDRVTLGFEELLHGEIVDEISTLCGPVTVHGRNGRFLPDTPNAAIVFDSNCPPGGIPETCSGESWDLGTPNEAYFGPGRSRDTSGLSNDTALNNLLIVARDLEDGDGDDLVDDPADEEVVEFNPTLFFDFSATSDGSVTVESIDVIDIEVNQTERGAGAQFFDGSSALIASGFFPLTGDNGVALGWNDWSTGPTVEDVVSMTVALQGSGGMDNLTFSCEREIPPPTGNKGCSQGYWKEHRDSWPPTDYSPEQTLYPLFEEVLKYPSLAGTPLIGALNFDGGEEVEGAARNLFRQAVAAILNAAHPGVFFPLTEEQVIDAVNEGLASRDRGTILYLKDKLDRKNNFGCTLN